MPPKKSLSKHVVKTDLSAETFQNAASALASDDGGKDGALFNPMEAIASGIRSGNAVTKMLVAFWLLFARGIIAPVELILRSNFGERYFSAPVTLMVATYLFAAYRFLGIHWAYCSIIAVIYIGLLAQNQCKCYKRNREGGYWHSYSEGESWFREEDWDARLAKKNFTFDLSKLVFEPVIVILLGILSLPLPKQQILGFHSISPLAFYFLLAGITLFFYQLYCYRYRRNLLLDEKDNAIIAEIHNQIVEHTGKPGIFNHKGVSYTVLGGSNGVNQ